MKIGRQGSTARVQPHQPMTGAQEVSKTEKTAKTDKTAATSDSTAVQTPKDTFESADRAVQTGAGADLGATKSYDTGALRRTRRGTKAAAVQFQAGAQVDLGNLESIKGGIEARAELEGLSLEMDQLKSTGDYQDTQKAKKKEGEIYSKMRSRTYDINTRQKELLDQGVETWSDADKGEYAALEAEKTSLDQFGQDNLSTKWSDTQTQTKNEQLQKSPEYRTRAELEQRALDAGVDKLLED